MEKNKGYLLPPGEAYTDDMACTLVFYPDKPEYRRALGGSLAYLATWIAWEKESEHKGIDAALSWKTAYDLTMDCWNMACLEELQDNVAEILAIMQMGNPCCDEQDVSDGDRYTDRVTDGEGDVPQNIIDAGYADDAADWEAFDDYKCMISHVIVDQLDARLLEIAPIVNQFGMVFGGAIALAGILAAVFSAGSVAFIYGLIAATGTVGALYANLLEGDLLQILAGKVSDNHDELACAVYQSDGDEGALVALNDKIDELFSVVEAIIVKSLNLGPTLKALYSGRYDQQDIAELLEEAGYDVDDFECTCDFPVGEFQLSYAWPANDDWLGWIHETADWLGSGNPNYAPATKYGTPQGFVRLMTSAIATELGISNPSNRIYLIHKITFQYYIHASAGTPKLATLQNAVNPWVNTPYTPIDSWTDAEMDYGEEPLLLEYDGAIQFTQTGGSAFNAAWDNVIIDFDVDLL
jgi:hypothetical protein